MRNLWIRSFCRNYILLPEQSAAFKKIVKPFSKTEFIDTSYEDGTEYEREFNAEDFMPVDKVKAAYSKLNALSDMLLRKGKLSVIC